ncbi:MAG: hypothetical protein A3C93_00980 [Candidatus Lloydbacteria bacterium RIFCSPHIGHO2_02_FULL_54_17]|uniref:Uncharacterized protein n=1 Tax=Candidatus Lloydbacteria bacterium RIFCSPHIGHO2_02_FULL_54_17 TaxID=1798664 RepID=A0A1G2DF29_9BACT|nr:MAG: hypothetical protein A2762_01555 [Candidatus Lloydbacteria bacterium RIFCSPHIGHO2_01_FULL_54_11]OGZ11561.1 MAG: hypothetical protein A3C93_00980 [Candidatus Lloydbacteria bacterium RIFCSPHIGHO2_02_FULL_54_17]OGZ14843.1 MAG: hypothetical protein A3H76_05175 [Candidatus Lloydbacteria bacterium RIFCSPLOWO2_02_FULL_54_12]
MKTAFVTYNTVGHGELPSGLHTSPCGAEALVLQNTKGEAWGAKRAPGSYERTPSEGKTLTANRQEEIGALWEELQKHATEIDHLVVYVGANGSQRAVALSAQLPPERVTYVLCNCSLPAKENVIALMGMSAARRVDCECGGHDTMRAIFDRFMERGTLDA